MPKQFFTEKDIEDMARRGDMSLRVDDNVVLTELAYEKARRLGVQLVSGKPETPPAAPVRPYIAQSTAPVASAGAVPAPGAANSGADLHQKVRAAVMARLGGQVDAKLLDVIITRVLNSTGLK